MPEIADYNQSDHTHTHICPLCHFELALLDDTERPKFRCENTDCLVETCYCNGTVKESTVNRQTLEKYIYEEYSESYDVVISKLQSGEINDVFAEKLIDLLQKRKVEKFTQSKESGERVLAYEDVFIPWSQMLRYTVTTGESDGTLRTALQPIKDCERYEEEEVEQFVGLL